MDRKEVEGMKPNSRNFRSLKEFTLGLMSEKKSKAKSEKPASVISKVELPVEESKDGFSD